MTLGHPNWKPTDDLMLALAVFCLLWPLFLCGKLKKICGQILPSLAHLNLGGAPPEAPHITCDTHFSEHQDFLWYALEKGEGLHAKKTQSDRKNTFQVDSTQWKSTALNSVACSLQEKHHGDGSVKEIVQGRPSDTEECCNRACLPVWHHCWSPCAHL